MINSLFKLSWFYIVLRKRRLYYKFNEATAQFSSAFQTFLKIKKKKRECKDEVTDNKLNEILTQFNGLVIDKPDDYPFQIKQDMIFKKCKTSFDVITATINVIPGLSLQPSIKAIAVKQSLERQQPMTPALSISLMNQFSEKVNTEQRIFHDYFFSILK